MRQLSASLRHLGRSTFFEVYGQKPSKFLQFSTMGEDSHPPTPTSEVRGREKSSKKDKNTTEVRKSVGTSAPQKGGKKSFAPKDGTRKGSSNVTLKVAALGSVITEALKSSFEDLRDSMNASFTGLGDLIASC